MKKNDIEVGKEYLVGRYGTGAYAQKERAIVMAADVSFRPGESNYSDRRNDRKGFRVHFLNKTTGEAKTKVARDDDDNKVTVVDSNTLPSRYFMREWVASDTETAQLYEARDKEVKSIEQRADKAGIHAHAFSHGFLIWESDLLRLLDVYEQATSRTNP